MPNCKFHPPLPRPEPFSPLPLPGCVPDWGKWIRDRLAEKGALLAFPSASAFPDPGAQPNVYEALDTGTLYRWDGTHYQVLVDPSAANDVLEYEDRGRFPETGEHGKLYIAADAGSVYRWGGEGYVELGPDVSGFVDGAEYDAEYGDPPKPAILLKHGNEVVATVDAADFVIDGMVSNVEVKNGNLVITFNTDSGKQPILIPLTDIFDPANYYDKTAADGKFVAKADVAATVTQDGANPVKSSGIWLAIWGALATLPTGFSSLYDWCVSQFNGFVAYVKDKNGNKTAVTIGVRKPGSDVGQRSLAAGNTVTASGKYAVAEGQATIASGHASHAEGYTTEASGDYSHAEGHLTVASASYSHAAGERAEAKHNRSWVWASQTDPESPNYQSHGSGTFNVSPTPANGSNDPASGFYIGERTLKDRLDAYKSDADIVRKSSFMDEKFVQDLALPSKEAGYLQPDGTVKTPASTARGVTDYIEITKRTITVLSGVVAVNDGLTYACFYDAGKSFLSALTKETSGLFTGDIAVPSGAKYIRFTLADATVPAKVDMFVRVQDMAFGAGDTMDLVDRLGAQLGTRADVSFAVDAIFKGFYVKATDGTEGSSATRACTDYLIVNNDRRIAFTGATGSIADSGYCYGCVYDAEKNFIQPILAADYTQGDVLDLPADARYIRLNVASFPSAVTITQSGFIADRSDEFNFLLIGSSFGLCSVLQFPFLVADAGIKICCGNLYKSAVSLPTIAEQIENETENGWDKGMIFTNEVGEWASATTDLDTMLRAKKWDCISVQRSAADKKTWNAAQEAALETIIGHIRDVCGEEGARPQIVLNTIFATEEFSTDKQSQCNETMEIVNTALAIKKRFGIDITNVAMTVQNVRLTSCAPYGSAPNTDFHDLACDDNGHLDYGVGSYVAGLALFEQLILPRFGKSVLCVEKVASLDDLSSTGVVPANKYTAPDDAFKSIAKICALVSWANPYEISTGLAHAYPTSPETVVHPGKNAMLDYIGAQPTLSDAQLANIAAVSDALAFDATHSYAEGDPVVHDGTLYTFTAAHTGAWTGSDVSAVDIIARLAGKADVSAIPYSLGTPIVIGTASPETVEGETVYFGAATLANRTANIVQVTETLDELRITFPAATSGKVRDFGLRVEIGTGSAALTAPALVPIAPTGETIKIENADGTIPALADGTATAKGVTLLYFSETAPGVFVVKGEQVEDVA